MTKISRSLSLARSSWRILMLDRELFAIPLLSLLAAGVVLAVAGLPVALRASDADGALAGVDYVILGIAAVAITFAISFGKAALVAGAHTRMSGGDPTLGSSFEAARSVVPALLGWSLLTVTLTVVLRTLGERIPFVGALAARLAEAAWEVVTFLAIPVIVLERTGPIDAVKRSGSLFKRSWGENLSAQVGFGLLGLVLVIPAVVLGGGAAATGSVALAVVGIAAAVLWLAAVVVGISALEGVFQAALYRFAATGEVAGEFGQELPDAFAPKDGKRRSWM